MEKSMGFPDRSAELYLPTYLLTSKNQIPTEVTSFLSYLYYLPIVLYYLKTKIPMPKYLPPYLFFSNLIWIFFFDTSHRRYIIELYERAGSS